MAVVDGLITFSLIIIESLFVFDYLLVLTTEIIGLGALVWIRFMRFPPFFAAYEQTTRPRALLQQAEVRRSRGHHPQARRTPAAAPAAPAQR
jgi:hypothetical protein